MQRLLSESSTYKPYSEVWSKEEWISYITTLMEGDGCYFDISKLIRKYQYFSLCSTNIHFLQYITKELKKHNILNFSKPYLMKKYTRKGGTKGMEYLLWSVGGREKNKKVLESLLPYMTMDRKKQNGLKNLAWIDSKLG